VESCADADVGIVPIGTGNDFCRNFDSSFDDVAEQFGGSVVKCDAIRYTTETENGTVTGYCANMFNIGFDCNVSDMTANMKKKPFISGSMAYFISILVNLITKKGENLRIEVDDTVKHSGLCRIVRCHDFMEILHSYAEIAEKLNEYRAKHVSHHFKHFRNVYADKHGLRLFGHFFVFFRLFLFLFCLFFLGWLGFWWFFRLFLLFGQVQLLVGGIKLAACGHTELYEKYLDVNVHVFFHRDDHVRPYATDKIEAEDNKSKNCKCFHKLSPSESSSGGSSCMLERPNERRKFGVVP
jgi:hypothetical protein